MLGRLQQLGAQILRRASRSLSSAAQTQAQTQPCTHYEVLGVPRSATAAEIKHAFRQKAKALHPDRLAAEPGSSPGDAAAFLRLVAAYEELRDPTTRRLYDYDTATDTGLPRAMRDAAAATAAAAAAAPQGQQASASAEAISSWRWGLGPWAEQQLAAAAALAEPEAAQRSRLASAVAKYRRELESDLAAGLLKAFVGPELDTPPHELPPAFEADERRHLALSLDLLHLVHGRTLLGVVRERQPLHLTGGSDHQRSIGSEHESQALPGPTGSAALPAASTAEQPPVGHQLSESATAACSNHGGSSGVASDGSSSGETGQEVIGEAEWGALLRAQHPLRLPYDWEPAAADTASHSGAESPEASTAPAADTASLADADGCIARVATGQQPATSSSSSSSGNGTDETAASAGSVQSPPWISRGGCTAFAAWQQQQQQQQLCHGHAADAPPAHTAADDACSCPAPQQGVNQQLQQHDCWWQQLPHFQEQQQEQQQQRPVESDEGQQGHSGVHSSVHGSNHSNKQQRHGPSFRRMRAWLQTPSADWAAADWTFGDADAGVTVLELLLGGPRVAAVALRDQKQPGRPIKVYVAGEFVLAVLDDVVMEPLTGRLLAVMYRFYTPGVHHLFFYQPFVPQPGGSSKQTGASRVLARCQRRWMPPSSTWLFPPRSDEHDGGGWLIEWEGHAQRDRSGWLHPAVYVLTAAAYSLDMEARRQASPRRQLWSKLVSGLAGTRIGKLLFPSWCRRQQQQQQMCVS